MPTLLRAAFGSLEHVHAGVGDNHVYTPEGTNRIFDEAFQLLRIRHIRGAVERAYALLFYRLAESLHARIFRRLTRTACHMGASLGKLLSDAQPDPGGNSSDQDHLIFIIEYKAHRDQI